MAKKFQFGLEPVLKIREHNTQLAEEDLYRVLRLRFEKELELKEKKNYFQELLSSKVISTKAENLQNIINHRNKIESEIATLEAELHKLNEIETIHRNKLNEALKKEKVLVNLKERQKKVYNADINKEERHLLDEIGLQRHGK